MPLTVTIPAGARGADFTALTDGIKQYILANRLAFVCRYVNPYGVSKSWKAITADEIAWYQANKIAVTLIYEGRAADAGTGRTGGLRNGAWARVQANSLPGGHVYPHELPVTACCDKPVTTSTLASILTRAVKLSDAIEYMRAFREMAAPDYTLGEYAPSALGRAVPCDYLCIPGATSWSKDVFDALKAGRPLPLPVHLIQGSGPGGGIDIDTLRAHAPFPAWLPTPDPPPGGDRPVHHRTLRYGRRGPDVKALQHMLGVKPESGFFLAKTRAAVIYFQARHGLKPDGIVGPVTWAALDRGLR